MSGNRGDQLGMQTAARKMTRLKSLNPINGSGQNYYVDQCVSVLAGEAPNASGVFQASDLEWNKMVDENNEMTMRLRQSDRRESTDPLAVNHPDPVPSKHIPECNKFCDPQTGVHHLH